MKIVSEITCGLKKRNVVRFFSATRPIKKPGITHFNVKALEHPKKPLSDSGMGNSWPGFSE